MNKIKNFFKDKTAAFYVALGAAGLTLITAITYAAVYGGGEFMSWAAFAVMLAGIAAFAVLSIFSMPRIGTAVMAATNFTALLLFIFAAYDDLWSYFNNILVHGTNDGAGYAAKFIIMCILMLCCFVACNVCAWIKLVRQSSAEPVSEVA